MISLLVLYLSIWCLPNSETTINFNIETVFSKYGSPIDYITMGGNKVFVFCNGNNIGAYELYNDSKFKFFGDFNYDVKYCCDCNSDKIKVEQPYFPIHMLSALEHHNSNYDNIEEVIRSLGAPISIYNECYCVDKSSYLDEYNIQKDNDACHCILEHQIWTFNALDNRHKIDFIINKDAKILLVGDERPKSLE